MLVGQYTNNVDSKGRIAIPKRLREQLGESVVVTKGYEQSLILLSAQGWEELIRGTGDKPFIIDAARDTNRFLFGNAMEIDLDDQGRLVIPGYLREYAEIEKEAVFVGVGRYVEVWNQTRWARHQEYLMKNISVIARNLSTFNDTK